MNDTANTIHPFEAAGLGIAPFRCTGVVEKSGPIKYPNGMEVGAPGQPMGTCEFCGNGIKYCCQIVSHDGRHFEVGCDCVEKLHREDNALATAAQRIRADIRRKQQEERAERRLFTSLLAAEWYPRLFICMEENLEVFTPDRR